MKTKQAPPLFRVGQRVTVPLGPRDVPGIVAEERGALGIGGRYLYHVHVPMEPYDPMFLVCSEEEMAAADEPPPLEPGEVVKYLVNGGLVSILWSNLEGGKNQPRAWLCRTSRGGVTHTFLPERGMVGGQAVPFFALHGDKVFAPKAAEVVTFVESFGLNRREAEKVVAEAGTAP